MLDDNIRLEVKTRFRLQSSHDIHFASITKQIKLVFEMNLLVFAKTNFFQKLIFANPNIYKCFKPSEVQTQIEDGN